MKQILRYALVFFVLVGCSNSEASLTETPLVADSTTVETSTFDLESIPVTVQVADIIVDTHDIEAFDEFNTDIVIGRFVEKLNSQVLDESGHISTRYVFEIDRVVKGTIATEQIIVTVPGGYLNRDDYEAQATIHGVDKKAPSQNLYSEKHPHGQAEVEETAIVAYNFGTNPVVSESEPEESIHYVLYLGVAPNAVDEYAIATLTHGFKTIDAGMVYSVGDESAAPFPLSRYLD